MAQKQKSKTARVIAHGAFMFRWTWNIRAAAAGPMPGKWVCTRT